MFAPPMIVTLSSATYLKMIQCTNTTMIKHTAIIDNGIESNMCNIAWIIIRSSNHIMEVSWKEQMYFTTFVLL